MEAQSVVTGSRTRKETGFMDERTTEEQSLLEDIAYFEDKVRRLGTPGSSYERAMLRVYASLLSHRRQRLAALRDGHPDAWYEYDRVLI
ncbi:MAG: hypothetical protein PVJ40_03265 [Gammaproteobacteria bacterium]|jgi:hypothetical protein